MKYIKRKHQQEKRSSIVSNTIQWIGFLRKLELPSVKKNTVQRVDIVNAKITASQVVERRREVEKEKKDRGDVEKLLNILFAGTLVTYSTLVHGNIMHMNPFQKYESRTVRPYAMDIAFVLCEMICIRIDFCIFVFLFVGHRK